MTLKSIDDEDLVNGSLIKHYCEKCNKNVVMKILYGKEGMLGECCSCRKYTILKRDENYIPKTQEAKNIPMCPICKSTNLKKITFTKRAIKTAVFGAVGAIDDAGKTYQCCNCGSKF